MPLLTRSRAALLIALPALLVPAIEIPLVFWARQEFLDLHPGYADEPPTISRAISEPVIGGPFASLHLLITALILITLPVLAWAYLHAIARLPLEATRRRLMQAVLVLFLLCQVVACFGTVLTTQFTFANNEPLHMLGSYIFFVAQALAILLAATLCRLLLHQQQKHGIDGEAWPFRPGMHRFRFRFALAITLLSIGYGVLFFIKDWPLPVSSYAVHTVYTQWEVVVVTCFVLFLGSYALDIRDMVHRDKLPARLGWTPPERRDRG